jgi:hypothetical protein
MAENMSIRELTHSYYEAWAARDREGVGKLLHSGLVFISPQGSFDSADSYLSASWGYSAGLAGVRFVRELYQEDRAFVILQWLNEDGSTFADAEYLESSHGRIKTILVVSYDAVLGELIE